MSAPQPPADGAPEGPPRDDRRDLPAPTSGATPDDTRTPSDSGARTYEFHGEELDFDPYRFGAPEPTTPTWDPTAPSGSPAGDPARPPAPGERWTPGGDSTPDVRPGDYWQGGGSRPRSDAVFPPAGYAPPPTGASATSGSPGGPVDLGKPASPGGQPSGSASPYPSPSNYPPPSAYPPPGGYPGQTSSTTNAGGGNGLAVAGMVVGIAGIVLALFTWPGIIVGLVGLGLSIAGLVRARRGARHKGLAWTGLICSAVAIVLGSVLLAIVLSRVDFDCVRDANGNFEQAQECVR